MKWMIVSDTVGRVVNGIFFVNGMIYELHGILYGLFDWRIKL